jgi:hypothetical protein
MQTFSHDLKSIIPDEIQYDLNLLPSSAYLFGSRSMIGRKSKNLEFDPAVKIASMIDDTTDWDISMQFSDENHERLLKQGFTCHQKENLVYRDDLTVNIYSKEYVKKKDFPDLSLVELDMSTRCHVVLRSDFYLFRAVWESIDPEFYYNFLWKRSLVLNSKKKHLVKDDICKMLNQLYATARYMI